MMLHALVFDNDIRGLLSFWCFVFRCYILLVFPKRLHSPFPVPTLYVMLSEPELPNKMLLYQTLVHIIGDSKVYAVIIIDRKDEVYDWENMIKFKIF